MTLNVYAELFDDDLDAIASKLDEAVSRARADSLPTGTSPDVIILSREGA